MLSREMPEAYLTIAFGIFPCSWNITAVTGQRRRKDGMVNEEGKWI
jgi:hypothetical protein